ncbi:interleukin-12 subunit alpha-like [Notolabrus celidotus]|uniref:interleukin-12 subunit alpha-like n=1 Tax=Notolabrus celidotus TaxID=1203425 RepID=UPI00149077D9|nr:interleukin-12 subunit alpha-like [Notolabrus celidotus]
MAIIKLHFSAALLVLLLSCPLWQVSQSVPVMSKALMTDSCVLNAHKLLQDITTTLTQLDLFEGIICSEQRVEMNTKTNTASVCAPAESTCSGIVESEFDEGLCLTNITEDLHHYYNLLSTEPDPSGALSKTVLSSLRELMENCFMSPPEEGASNRESTDPFKERLSLCKVLKGFHVRAITINRAISYINSGVHTK